MVRIPSLNLDFITGTRVSPRITKKINDSVYIAKSVEGDEYRMLDEARSTIGNYARHKGLQVNFSRENGNLKMGVKNIYKDSDFGDFPLVTTKITDVGETLIENKSASKPEFLRNVYNKLAEMSEKAVRESRIPWSDIDTKALGAATKKGVRMTDHLGPG